MPHNRSSLLVALALLTTVTACTPKSPIAPNAEAPQPTAKVAAAVKVAPAPKPQAEQKKPDYRYSPFVLRMPGHETFEVISFKDVGVRGVARDNKLYKVVAEGLARELASSKLRWRAQVAYDKSVTDPNNHFACGFKSLYIDFWRSDGPDRWGYSLWSGCDSSDNFAWKEIKLSPDASKAELSALVKPLAHDIAETLHSAHAKSCFTKVC